MNLITSILRKFKQDKNINILTCPTHETYETYLSKTPDTTFWSLLHPSVKDWNLTYRKVPSNYNIIRSIPDWLEIDLVLVQNRFGQFQLLNQFSKQFSVPLVTIEHTWPVPSWDNNIRNQMRKMSGNVDCFITKNSMKAWGWDETSGEVVNHGVDTDTFKPKIEIKPENVVLSICNDFINRDGPCGYSLWKEVTKNLPYRILGATPGLSEPAKSLEDLVYNYQSSSVFLNTSIYSPVPCVLMEAMSCGLPVVSTNTCEIPNIIEHGYNGFLGGNVEELKGYCELLLKDEKLRKQIGESARKTIVEKYNIDKFTNRWNEIFNKALNRE